VEVSVASLTPGPAWKVVVWKPSTTAEETVEAPAEAGSRRAAAADAARSERFICEK
jgi:hypothetical protein